MPPIDRQFPDPLKQLRQKHAAEAKDLAAQKSQRAGVLIEQEQIREAEAAKRQPTNNASKPHCPRSQAAALTNLNKSRPSTPPHESHLLPKGQETPDIKVPPDNPLEDPEIIPYVTGEAQKGEAPRGSIKNASQTYTRKDEHEGETLSGTKEMRAEGDNEDENISKRPKGILIPTKKE